LTEVGNLVVVGQGYVGLPLAQEAVQAGIHTVGLDLNEAVVDGLNDGRSHVDDLTDSDVAQMLENSYSATSDPVAISQAQTIVICVPTPLSKDGTPDMAYVNGAIEMVANYVQPYSLVSLESTTYPGTTEDLLKPVLEEHGFKVGYDIFLAYSPERINPGDETYGFRNTPKVVGGATKECSRRASAFYAMIVDEVVPVSGTREAEMTKLIENTYRHVNIALMNELVQAARGLKVDLNESIRAAKTKPFGYQAFYPGPGVGGHCIPIDPNYLSYTIKTELGHPFRFVELAQEVNQSMPAYVVSRISDILNSLGKPINNSSILLLGVTYKSNIADQRESPAVPIARLLAGKGAQLSYHDPHVAKWTVLEGDDFERVPSLDEALQQSDLVVILQNHSIYVEFPWVDISTPVFDTRGVLTENPDVYQL